jgi:uncharacterized membrane protein YkoI
MTTLRKMASKNALTISAMLGAGILLSAMLVPSPSTFTWAQQQMIANNSNSTYNHTNQLGNPIPKINGSVNVVENIKNVFKESTKISLTAASETAQKQIPNSTILGGHLGVTQGYLTYTYFVVDPNKQTAYRVIIDAGNGKVLYTSQGLPIGSFNHRQESLMLGPGGGFGTFGHWNGVHGSSGGEAGSFSHFGSFKP